MSRRQVSKNCFGRHVSGRHMSGRQVSKNDLGHQKSKNEWGVKCPGVKCLGRQVSRPRGYRRQVSKKLIGRQVSMRQVSRASIVSGVKGPRSFKRQMSLRQKSIFGHSMSKNLWQCMSEHICPGVRSPGVRKDPPVH